MKCITAIAALATLFVFGTVDVKASTTTDDQPVNVIVTDFMCGLYRVQVADTGILAINNQPYGDYKTTMLDAESNYVHQFGDKAEIRVTQHSRVAFRLVGETRWNRCKPLVFYQEEAQ